VIHSIDWENFHQEAATHLQNLIRIPTINPPGNEMEAIKYVAEVLRKENIPYKIFEPAPGRGNLIATLKGNGQGKPLLLSCHLDVVPVEEKSWRHHPFSGDVIDDCIWGRGSIDMKQMAVMELMMLLTLKRNLIVPKRDIIFTAVADEEAGCTWGSKWLTANVPDMLNAEFALNEVGGFSLHVDGDDQNVFYPIGVAERGWCWLTMNFKGDPGHGSLPHANQAIVKAAQAVEQLDACCFPIHIHPIVRNFVTTIASHQKISRRWLLKGLLTPGLNSFLLNKIIPKNKRAQFKAMLSNTAAPTIMKAGSKENVIPGTASLTIDGRIVPGQNSESFLKELEKIVGVQFDLEPGLSHEPTEIGHYDNDFYQLLAKNLIKHDKRAIPVPYVIPGYTDAAYWSTLGIKCYGFAPVKLEKDIPFSSLFHGHDERIPVEGFLFGLHVMWDVIQEWCV